MIISNNDNHGSKRPAHWEESCKQNDNNKKHPACLGSFLKITIPDGLTVFILLLKREYAS